MYRVLIVEDDPMVAMINEQYVNRNKQFRVVKSCRDGKSALDYLMEHEVDLLVLDVFMPYMSGVELLREIRARQIALEVIMVTAANDSSTLEETIHLGVLDYLVKPFAFDRFQIALEKYVSQMEVLQNNSTLSQKKIDSIIENARGGSVDRGIPKGIQERTLTTIRDFFGEHPGEWFTGDQIAESVGLSGVTVRRYLGHLVRLGELIEDTDYETGGRPSTLYRTK